MVDGKEKTCIITGDSSRIDRASDRSGKRRRKFCFVILLVSVLIIFVGCGKNGSNKNAEDLKKEQQTADAESAESGNVSSSEKDNLSDSSDKSGNTNKISGVDISFDFIRASGPASNQVAVWVENSDGNVVKTLYVSNFTGKARGYEKRKDALKHWVVEAEPEKMTDQEMDAVSGATPENGTQKLSWDLTDSEGKAVPAGTYRICLEGTLFWGSNVLYSGNIDLLNDQPGEVKLLEDRSDSDNSKNASMIQNVAIIER